MFMRPTPQKNFLGAQWFSRGSIKKNPQIFFFKKKRFFSFHVGTWDPNFSPGKKKGGGGP